MSETVSSDDTAQRGVKAPGVAAIQDWLIAKISESLEIDPAEIDIREPFANYGLTSVASVSLTGDMEDWLGLRLSPTLAWDYPTVEELAQHLAREVKTREAAGALRNEEQ
jgi:acyl carrier protein